MSKTHKKTMQTSTEVPQAEESSAADESAVETAALSEAPAPAETNIAGYETVPAPKPRKDKILTPQQKRKRAAIRFILMNIGIVMMSLSVYFFQTPNNFTLGGVAGIAILLASVIPIKFFTQAVIMAIINVVLLVAGLIILGKQCTFKTIYCTLLYTGIIWIFEFTDVIGHIPGHCVNEFGLNTVTDQPFLELAYSILLFGVGGALVFNCGASSGGTDIIALILKKFTNLNTGVALLIIDLIVVCVSIFTFQNVEIALFSFMGLFTRSFLLDGIIESIGKTKYITIITTNPEEISKYILEVIQHGFTKYSAEGGYTGEKKSVLVTVCSRREASKLKQRVKELDHEAFVIITDANEILGKGFGGTY